jgi:twitching motility two-component system response regulator PilH
MGKTVLAVDDEAQTRDFFSTVLEESGYTPVLAEDGEQAMEIILQNKPDLIILDIMMPKQSGIKIYRQLKRDESLRDIPVIICSGLPRRTLLRAQAALTQTSGESVPEPDAYLEKPVTPERLEATIKKILG